MQNLQHSSKKNLAKNLNTFLEVCQNTRISSYVENIFTETPNEKFDVSVNIFSTYEEIEPIRFGQAKITIKKIHCVQVLLQFRQFAKIVIGSVEKK